ncbi:MAG: hypothetical protein H6586_08360 [Flavobacteriales bacterium]|nr:hypothetical protein [Flavobacteriales bacterium]
MNKEKLTEIIEKYLEEDDVRKDFDVLLPIINANEIQSEDLSKYLKSIGKNIEFFRKELNYPLQLSNLLLFELDAKKKTYRGTLYRQELIDDYKNLLK